MRLLVVDDEPRMAVLLKRGFGDEGYAVDVANDGTDALWLGSENPYDAIILDIMLPGIDGIEVCRKLREAQRWAPIIMLSARDGVDDRVRGLDAGADDYLARVLHPAPERAGHRGAGGICRPRLPRALRNAKGGMSSRKIGRTDQAGRKR